MLSQTFPAAALWIGVVATGLCMSVAVYADADAASVPSGTVLFDLETDDLTLSGAAADSAEVETIQVAGQPFERAYRVVVPERAPHAYDIQLRTELDPPLTPGRVMLLTGYMRTLWTEAETNEGMIAGVVEQAGGRYDKEIQQEVAARSEWEPFYLPYEVRHDHDETGSQLAIRVGYAPQRIEIGGLRLIDYGTEAALDALPRTEPTYEGQADDAPWRAPAAERIEQYRKGDLRVEVVDAAGEPVRDAEVHVKMTRHGFEFGSVYNPRRITGSSAEGPDSERYRNKFVELFNVAVDEWMMKWPAWVDAEHRETALSSFAWMEERGIPVRGHTMIWPSWRRTPDSLESLAGDPEALRQRAAEHIASVGTAFAGRVPEWDVVNEPYTHYDMLEILGREIMVEWFKLAREADPDAVLYLNEAGQPNSPPDAERYDVFYDDLQMLLDGGAPLGGIGMQGHFGQHLNSPEQLLAIYDRFAEFDLPIKITELDINHPDAQIQADYMRDFLTVSFSHPSIDGILLWGFWENQHWMPDAALWDSDWNIRPVGQAWMDLVHDAWWTDVTEQSNDAGVVQTRAFHGEHEVSVTHDGRTSSQAVTVEGDAVTVRVVLE